MTVKEKRENLFKINSIGPVTIVAFGDSVTHGAVATGEMNHDTVYHNLLKRRLNRNAYMTVNVINSGICGDTAKNSLKRIDRDVMPYNPDLIIVCFGLNDVNYPLCEYEESLRTVLEKCKSTGGEVIFMTPNMMNTRVTEDAPEDLKEFVTKMADYQTSGRMDSFMDTARRVSAQVGVKLCDCYAEWKRLESEGVDVSKLLANRSTHPNKPMHKLFADKLYDMIMETNEYNFSEFLDEKYLQNDGAPVFP